MKHILYISLAVTILTFWFVSGIGFELSALDSCLSHEHKIQTQAYYKAGVVEYKPISIGSQTPEETLKSNVQVYIELMQQAHEQNVDIIVFPEYGLTTIALPPQRENAREYFVQIPSLGVVPCDNVTNLLKQYQILYRLSCAAKDFNMYVVVNLGELENCDPETDSECPSDKGYHFNTNIVFDRSGAIIARYRKIHLYFEPQFNYPSLEYSTFKTDFGVEFGLFTCFDIIFAHPAVELVANQGIRNFAFPTAWIDELPFLMAIQAQSLWAQSNQANLLASGYHQPERGSMGSGIYSGHNGALNYVFDSSSGTKLVISSVPVIPELLCESPPLNSIPESQARQVEPYHMWLREDLSNCTHKTINPKEGHDSLCYNNDFCCGIEYDLISSEDSGQFKLLVFDGIRTVAAKRDWFEWQVCAILKCLNDTIESCTENVKDSSSRFRSIKIQMRPLKIEYEQQGAAEPGLSLIDTNFNLIPQSYFEIRKWTDSLTNVTYVEAKSKDSQKMEIVNVKTVSLINKIYGGRI